jgi:hypothetical protein
LVNTAAVEVKATNTATKANINVSLAILADIFSLVYIFGEVLPKQ